MPLPRADATRRIKLLVKVASNTEDVIWIGLKQLPPVCGLRSEGMTKGVAPTKWIKACVSPPRQDGTVDQDWRAELDPIWWTV